MPAPVPSRPAPVRRLAALVLAILLGTHAGAAPRAVDVLVLGAEPEAIAAAVAAGESGARTVLASEDARLGGLFVAGALNVLDVRTSPVHAQRGLFWRWWGRVGGGMAFDVARAERAFAALLDEAGVEVRLGLTGLEPTIEEGRIVGARYDGGEIAAGQVIDGHADMEHAAAAGAPFEFAWHGFGVDLRMADTLTFRIAGVDWAALRAAASARGRDWATVDERVAWGSFGGIPASYPPTRPDLRLRGLNLGREDDGSVWVNALLIHGVDPFDPASRREAREAAEAEARRVVPWLAERLPGFENARFDGAAERLYVRESRHLEAACVLTADHLLDNVTGPSDIAVGGYPLDLQSLTRHDSGYVFGTPELYGVPLCVTVPAGGPDGLWVVGKSAGYDPVAHASARVVPLGMAVAEGVGVAAARAAREGRTPREVAGDAAFVSVVRRELIERGAYLPEPHDRAPVGPHEHPHHDAYRRMLGRGLALGGYGNRPGLDEAVPATSHVYLLSNVATRFFGDAEAGRALVEAHAGAAGDLTAEAAAPVQRAAACRLTAACPGGATPGALAGAGLWPDSVPTSGPLRRGAMYELAAALADRAPPRPPPPAGAGP